MKDQSLQALRTPPYWEKAKAFLTEKDAVMAELIAQYHGESLSSRGDAFGTLARSIAGQQISVKAADSIWRKLEARLDAVAPQHVIALEEEVFRSLGFSRQKIAYLKNVSHYFVEHTEEIATWEEASDAHIITELTSIKGVGKWTAEMFLIFYLLKPDVFPVDDIGVLKAIAQHYGDGVDYKTWKKADYLAIAQQWKPYSTVATWYLWRSLDPLPVEY